MVTAAANTDMAAMINCSRQGIWASRKGPGSRRGQGGYESGPRDRAARGDRTLAASGASVYVTVADAGKGRARALERDR